MKHFALVTIFAMAMSWPVFGDEQESKPSSDNPRQTFATSLAVVMQLI